MPGWDTASRPPQLRDPALVHRWGRALRAPVRPVEPAVVAHDLHIGYLSTRYALEREGVEPVGVQHHHAHLAACLAEHGVTGDAVGAIYDGAGLGPDRTVWEEILAGGIAGYERAGLLFPIRLPGGDAAARQPWRMACAWLAATLEVDEPPIPRAFGDSVTAGDWQAAARLCATGVNSPLTTSARRLFDAVAPAICGIHARVTYEGQAAAETEGITDTAGRERLHMPLIDARDGAEPGVGTIIDPRETVRALAADVAAGAEPAMAGARFHSALARGYQAVAEDGQSRRRLRYLSRRVPGGAGRARPGAMPAGDAGSWSLRACPRTTAASPTARRRSQQRAAIDRRRRSAQAADQADLDRRHERRFGELGRAGRGARRRARRGDAASAIATGSAPSPRQRTCRTHARARRGDGRRPRARRGALRAEAPWVLPPGSSLLP